MTVLLRQIDRVADRRALARALLVLAPLVLAASATGDPLWAPAALVTASSFIAMEQAGLAPLGVALHGLAIAAGFLLLLTALPAPPLFAVAAAAIAAGAFLLAAKGQRLRTPGNYVFIPALYIACELSETSSAPTLDHGLAFLPYVAFAIAPVILLSALEHASDRAPHIAHTAHLFRAWRAGADFGPPIPLGEGLAAVAVAVAIAALFAEWRHAPDAQWVVWSAASVVTGDVASARRKLGDRAIGALIGVPLGLVLGFAAPHASWVLWSTGIGGVLTLIAFRLYPAAFGVRCALIALALGASGDLGGAAARIENVLVGGAIGVGLVLAVHEIAKLTGGRRAEVRATSL